MSTSYHQDSKIFHVPLYVVALVWFVAGWTIAWQAAWLGLAPEGVATLANHLAVLITLALIATTFFSGLQSFRRTGTTLAALPATLIQILLFHLLFFQIASHIGADQYVWDRPPTWGDWWVFTLTHACRAADVADTVDGVFTIAHVGTLPAVCLLLFHLLIGFVGVSLLVELVVRPLLKRRSDSSTIRQELGETVLALAICLPILWLLVWCLIAGKYSSSDWFYWGCTNVLKVIDFPDFLQLSRTRLHHIPPGLVVGSLGVGMRLVLAIILAALLDRSTTYLRVRFLDGIGTSEDQLTKFLQRPEHAAYHAKARDLLERQRTHRQGVIHRIGSAEAFAISLIFVTALGGMLATLNYFLPPRTQAVHALLAAAKGADQEQAQHAIATLGRMGSWAELAVPEIDELQQLSAGSERESLIRLLGKLGPSAGESLGRILRDDPDPKVQLVALRALAATGPDTSGYLIPALLSPDVEIRRTAHALLLKLGEEAVPDLAKQVTPQNHWILTQLIEELDPYWMYQREGSELFVSSAQSYAEVSRFAQQLRENIEEGDIDQIRLILQRLTEFGPAALSAITEIVEALSIDDSQTRDLAVQVLTTIGPGGVRALEMLLDRGRSFLFVRAAIQLTRHNDPSVRLAIMHILPEQSIPAQSVEILTVLLNDPEVAVRREAIRYLAALVPDQVHADVTFRDTLTAMLTDPEAETRLAALWALGRLPVLCPEHGKLLEQLLLDPEATIRYRTARLVVRHAPNSDLCMRATAKAATNPDPVIQALIQRQLRELVVLE